MDLSYNITVKYINKPFNLLAFGLILSFYILSASADVQPVFVSTGTDQAITIKLSGSITNVTRPITVTLGESQPANGTATAVSCLDGSNECITYTPNTGYVGIDTFSYVSTDSGEIPITESSTIAVNVGNAVPLDDGATPPTAIDDTLSELCLKDQQGEVEDLCADYDVATNSGSSEDLRQFLNALSPSSAAAAGTLSNDLASQQLNNIGKRLAALRSGQRLSSMGGLAFKHNNNTLSGAQVAQMFDNEEILTGGGGAADGYSDQWGWFINGTFGGGSQDETAYEDGFEFDTTGLSSGFDYRIKSQGVIGFAMGYANTELTLNLDGGGLDADGASLMVYGSYYPSSKTYIDSIITTGFYSLDSRRRIVFGTTNAVATSNPDSLTLALSVAGGYELFHTAGFTGTFEGRGEYITTTIDSYSETGSSPYDVTIEEQTYNSIRTLLSMNFVYATSLSWGALLPQLDVSWIHQFENSASTINGYFNVDPSTPFSFSSNTPDSDYFKVDLGVSALFPGGNTVYFQGSSLVTQAYYQSWYMSLGYRMEF